MKMRLIVLVMVCTAAGSGLEARAGWGIFRTTPEERAEKEAAREKAARDLLSHATTVETILEGAPPSWDQAVEALAQGFQEVLNLDLHHRREPGQERAS